MKNAIYLSKGGEDEYINSFAIGSGGRIINSDDFNYDDSEDPIVLRGILKHKIMKRCWFEGRDFYFMDTGYMGNQRGPLNPMGWKFWHRIVKNDLQHDQVIHRPPDRFKKLAIPVHRWKKGGRKILIAKPDEKPMKFYNLELEQWLEETIATIKKYTDRPIKIREKPRKFGTSGPAVADVPLEQDLQNAWACVTSCSISAVSAALEGVPVFSDPKSFAWPMASASLSEIEDPLYIDPTQWLYSLAYQQFTPQEFANGTAIRVLKEIRML